MFFTWQKCDFFFKFQNAFNPGQFYCGFDRCFKISENSREEVDVENERHNLSVMWSCLIGERCTFNVQQHSGLRQKLESILEETVDCNVYSSRVCRPCGRRIESLNKKYQVVMEQIRELRGKYYLACRKSTITVKRMSKSHPFCRESALSISTLQTLIPILSQELI